MSAFIKLKKQDAYIEPYTAHKSYVINRSEFDQYGIEGYYGERTPDFTTLYQRETDGEIAYVNGKHKHLVYSSIKHLYFSNYSESLESGSLSGSFVNFEQNTLFNTTRSLGERIGVLSIPKTLFGHAIRPQTFSFVYSGSVGVGLIYDDGEGKLIDSQSQVYVGEIIYPHGLAIITDSSSVAIIHDEGGYTEINTTVSTDTAATSPTQITAFSESQVTNTINTPLTSSVTYTFANFQSSGSDFKFSGNELQEFSFTHTYFNANVDPEFFEGPYTASGAPSDYWTGSGNGPFLVDLTSSNDIAALQDYLDNFISTGYTVDAIQGIRYLFTFNEYKVDAASDPQFEVYTIQITSSNANFTDQGLTGSRDYYNNAFDPGRTYGMVSSSNVRAATLGSYYYAKGNIQAIVEYTATSQSYQYTSSYASTASFTFENGYTWPSAIEDYARTAGLNVPMYITQDGAPVATYYVHSSSISTGGNTGYLVPNNVSNTPQAIGPYTGSNPAEVTMSYTAQGNGAILTRAAGDTFPNSADFIGTQITVDGVPTIVQSWISSNQISVFPSTPISLLQTAELSGSYRNNQTASYYQTMSFENSHDIYTMTYLCKVPQNMLNFSQNPSTTIDSTISGSIKSELTGSYFQPYVTTVGLYNEANELIAIGKLGQPIPKTPHTDMTFVVKLDI